MWQKKISLIGVMLVLMSITLIAQAAKLDGLLVYLAMNEGKGKIAKDGSGNDFDRRDCQRQWQVGSGFNSIRDWSSKPLKNYRLQTRPVWMALRDSQLPYGVFQENQQNTGVIQKGTKWGQDISYLIQPWSDGKIYFGVEVTASRAITNAGAHPLGKWYHLTGTFRWCDAERFLLMERWKPRRRHR